MSPYGDKQGQTCRNSDAMRARILEALGALILSEGLEGVGVNALARAAGCDKVLIYRYFGDLDGVYAAFAVSRDFWWSVEELTQGFDAKAHARRGAKNSAAPPRGFATFARRHPRRARFRANPPHAAGDRARDGPRAPLPRTLGVARGALLSARRRRSRHYRHAHRRRHQLPRRAGEKIRVMSGVAIQSDADWERIFAAIDDIVDAVVRRG